MDGMIREKALREILVGEKALARAARNKNERSSISKILERGE
jgi:hypothetical protein